METMCQLSMLFQVCKSPGLAQAPILLPAWVVLTTHHLSLFPFLFFGFVLLICQDSVTYLLQEAILDPLGALKDLYSYLPTYFSQLITMTFLSLSISKLKRLEIRDCILFTDLSPGSSSWGTG